MYMRGCLGVCQGPFGDLVYGRGDLDQRRRWKVPRSCTGFVTDLQSMSLWYMYSVLRGTWLLWLWLWLWLWRAECSCRDKCDEAKGTVYNPAHTVGVLSACLNGSPCPTTCQLSGFSIWSGAPTMTPKMSASSPEARVQECRAACQDSQLEYFDTAGPTGTASAEIHVQRCAKMHVLSCLPILVSDVDRSTAGALLVTCDL